MADKKFSQFTSQAMTATSKLVGIDGTANTIYDVTQLQNGILTGADVSLLTDVDLTTDVTGILPVVNGGTGASTLADGHILLGSGTSAISTLDLTTKGSIVVGDGATDPIALGVGTNGHVLTADSTEASGLKWAAPSGGTAKGIINGAADEIGVSSTAVSNPKQVTWAYPTISGSAYGPCMVVPIDMTVTHVSIKWQNTVAPTIPADPTGVVDWQIGKLTNPADASDTQNGTVNYTNIANLSSLTINNSDSGTNFFKSWTGTASFLAGDILVLLHSNPASSWSGTGVSTADCIVSMAVEYP